MSNLRIRYKYTYFFINFVAPIGGVAEWSMAAVLKTVVPKGTGGSNPSASAKILVFIPLLRPTSWESRRRVLRSVIYREYQTNYGKVLLLSARVDGSIMN